MAAINEGLFYTLAQATIALAGFSAVAIGLVAQQNRDWGVFEKAKAEFCSGQSDTISPFVWWIIAPAFSENSYKGLLKTKY